MPARSDAAEPRPAREHAVLLRVAQLAALCAWGVGTALIAVAANRPGLALVLGVLTAPAILVASWLPWAGIPVIAPLLGAASAGAAYPAVAGARGTIRERLVLGALGWYWMLCAAATLGLGSAGGLVDDPPHDWTRSTNAAAKALLGPLLAPEAVLGAAIFGAAAALLGLVLRAGHVAVALVGALLWAAGLEAAASPGRGWRARRDAPTRGRRGPRGRDPGVRRRGPSPPAAAHPYPGSSQFRGLKPPHLHTRRASAEATPRPLELPVGPRKADLAPGLTTRIVSARTGTTRSLSPCMRTLRTRKGSTHQRPEKP